MFDLQNMENINKQELVSRIAGKKIGILGAAKSGIAAALLAKRTGGKVFVSEYKQLDAATKKLLEKKRIKFEENGHTDKLLEMDLVIISPGVPGDVPIVKELKKKKISVVSEIEFAYWFDLGHIIAITGSQGKTTTTTLLGKIFDADNKVVFVGGNIGFPYSNFAAVSDEKTWTVLEVSSFQLEHIHYFKPKVVVLTNITPNHLDRYKSFDDYANAKLNILRNLDKSSLIVYNYDDALLHEYFKKNKLSAQILTFSIEQQENVNAFLQDDTVYLSLKGKPGELIRKDEIKLRGPHNIYNVMASALVSRALGIKEESCRSIFTDFSGLEHRLEWVDNVKGVDYYNDSKCTTVAALKYSLQSFEEKIVLIAGGKDKGGRFVDLRGIISDRVKFIILIGEAKDRIYAEWGGTVPIHLADSFEEAVAKAAEEADSGDVVLLSPACSSFDMFSNFENRGEEFKSLVKKLKET